MVEYTANNGTKVTYIDKTLTCVRKGLIMIFPNVTFTHISKTNFIAKNEIYKIYPKIERGEINSFSIEEL